MPRSFAQDVYELHKLLEAAKIKPPYILVGHSVGGIIARKFAKEYPNEVSGLLLVDATSENSLMDINGKIERVRLLASPHKKIPPLKEKVDTLTRIPSSKEIEELWNMMGKPSISQPFDKLPVPIQKARIWAQSLPKYYTADSGDFWAEEFAQVFSESQEYKIGDKPLIILCSTKNEYPKELGQAVRDSLMADKIRNQNRFLDISSNSKLITTANSGHEIHLTEPGLVADAIRQVISSVKTKQKLK
jgi:pimeloyl-ACP methyl ester carboxylesterase